jgi:hypothetical protein
LIQNKLLRTGISSIAALRCSCASLSIRIVCRACARIWPEHRHTTTAMSSHNPQILALCRFCQTWRWSPSVGSRSTASLANVSPCISPSSSPMRAAATIAAFERLPLPRAECKGYVATCIAIAWTKMMHFVRNRVSPALTAVTHCSIPDVDRGVVPATGHIHYISLALHALQWPRACG